jgi:hypothetical protein
MPNKLLEWDYKIGDKSAGEKRFYSPQIRPV